jgi:hypothetical protein
MPYCSITACLIVSDDQQDIVVEHVSTLIDSFVLRGITVYDTDLKCVTICDVQDPKASQKEMQPGRQPKVKLKP